MLKYFSSGLAQSEGCGNEEKLCGFTVKDIIRELRRGATMKCCGCKKPGGYIGCSVRHCQKAGHFPCLHKLNFCFHYGDQFEAFCSKHQPVQRVLEQINETCCICLSELMPFSQPLEQLYCPACCTTFHRSCIQVH